MDHLRYVSEWQGMRIELDYWPLKWNVVSYLTIKAKEPVGAPLPISATGFRSHFFAYDAADLSREELIEFVTGWLDEAAATLEWQRYREESRQLELF